MSHQPFFAFVAAKSSSILDFLLSSTDAVDACINRDMSMDAVDYEAESWSLTVEHKFCKKQDKRAVKRQDVIYGGQLTC